VSRPPRRRHIANAIDPASGFKVPLENLVRQYDGELIDRRFVDIRNPQDFVRGTLDLQALPYSRPEATDTFIEGPFLTEGEDWIYTEAGFPILSENSVTFEETIRELLLVENENYFILESGKDMLPEYVVTV